MSFDKEEVLQQVVDKLGYLPRSIDDMYSHAIQYEYAQNNDTVAMLIVKLDEIRIEQNGE
ncbi:MAG: hypothetical protein GQ474_08030 [Sulfurimonas sp.]|nr:hypothetical protein [Sulfurimonas sp.]